MKKLAAILVLALSISAFAQRRGGFGGFGGGGFGGGRAGSGGQCIVAGTRFGGDGSGDLSTPRDIDRTGFVYARLKYHMNESAFYEQRREVPWHHDYPDGDSQFPDSLGRLTKAFTSPDSYQIVDVDSKELFKYPFVYMSEAKYLELTPADAQNLREYLDRGGFLLADDFRGPIALENLRLQMKKVYPDREIVPLPPTHPIFHAFYEVDPQDMLPPYIMGDEQGPPVFMALSDPKGRIQVMVDYNNDMSEYWQALDVGVCSIHEAGKAVELGVNYAVYAMTH
jgi:hypothetical protein